EFARQRSLGHAGLSDEVASVPAQPGDLGSRLEPWAVEAAVATTVMDSLTHGMCGLDYPSAERFRIGLGEVDMPDRLAVGTVVIGRFTSMRVVDHLVRYDKHRRPEILADAAAGRDRQDLRGSQLLQGPH